MKTFLTNLRHAVQQRQSINVGGRLFSPDECKEVLTTSNDMKALIASMTFTVETVAHLRGMEAELLPVADKARAMLERLGD